MKSYSNYFLANTKGLICSSVGLGSSHLPPFAPLCEACVSRSLEASAFKLNVALVDNQQQWNDQLERLEAR
jgi:hypothetical protein